MAIIPIYSRPPLRPGERPLFALSAEDYEKVRQGYGCPECLEDFNGVYMLTCPVCGHARTAGEVVAVPQDWQEHYDEVKNEYVAPNVSVDEFIRGVMSDPDVDQIKL